jgi:hypothetical protein
MLIGAPAMTIYSYDFARSISDALHLPFEELPELSDQAVHAFVFLAEKSNVPGPYASQCANMSIEEKKAMTNAANVAKRGMKESIRSRGIKSTAQKYRWSNMDENMRKEMGRLSRIGLSENGKIKSIFALKNSVSPERQPGHKKEIVQCPHCHKLGGKPIMNRYHFERCKSK